MPTPNFSLDFVKVGIGILVIDLQGKTGFKIFKTNFSSI
jgi:hypothetical protein